MPPPLCTVTELWSALACAELWLSRYQPLIVGLLVVLLAFVQMVTARQSLGIQKQLANIQQEQQRSRMSQENTQRALAKLAVDRVLNQVLATEDRLIRQGVHKTRAGYDPFYWETNVLDEIRDLYGEPVGDIEENAALAFPDRATDIVQLCLSHNEVVKLATEYASQIDFPAYNLVVSHEVDLSAEQADLMRRVRDALNSLVTWSTRCLDLWAKNRPA